MESRPDYIQRKRQERGEQRRLLHELDLYRPLVRCRSGHDPDADWMEAYLVKAFIGDLVCLKSNSPHAPDCAQEGYWLARGGVDWPDFLSKVLESYRLGKSVPPQFRPRRKLPNELLSHIEMNPPERLPELFSLMRGKGFFTALPPLNATTCPLQLDFETLRLHFLDFRSSGRTL